MKDTSNTPSHRKHANSQCNCRQCKQFDYANTVNLSPVEQPSCLAVVEWVGAVDSETCERYDYYMVSPRKPIPIHKERKVKYAITTTQSYRKHANPQCNCRQCKQFDYANTVNLSPVEQPSPYADLELVEAIDSETWERYSYYMPSSHEFMPVS